MIVLQIFTTWKILGGVAIIFLIIFWNSRNSIWGGFTVGGIIGIVAAFFKEGKYDWSYVAKYAIIGVLVGFIADFLGWISRRSRK
jgi:hypothetical protein